MNPRIWMIGLGLVSATSQLGCAKPGCDPDAICGVGEGTESSSSETTTQSDTSDTSDTETSETETGPGEDCEPGDVADGVQLDASVELPVGEAVWSCDVTGTALGPPSDVANLDCVPADDPIAEPAAFDITIYLSSDDPPGVTLPFSMGEAIELRTYYDDFPPNFLSVVARGPNAELRLAAVEAYGADPEFSQDGWAAPFNSVTLEASECMEGSQTDQFVVVDGPGLAEPVRVRSTHAGLVSDADAGDFALRVTQATVNPDIVGGCNICVDYLLIPAG